MSTTIYVSLPDENVDTWRPVLAEHVRDNVYEIVAQPYDREVERWEFQPGDRVVCDYIDTSNGRVLAAVTEVGRG